MTIKYEWNVEIIDAKWNVWKGLLGAQQAVWRMERKKSARTRLCKRL